MDFNLLMDLRRYLTVAHHVPGRIRIKFSLKLLDDPRADELKQSLENTDAPPAIRSARVNVLGRSVVIEYDPEAVVPQVLHEALTTPDEARFEALAQELRAVLLPE